jgi:ferredoxin, 2Fe-2S
MIQLFFIQPDGAIQEASAVHGQTLLSAAREAGIDGFTAECGGNCTCATCHCYIEPTQAGELLEPSEEELAMLPFVASQREDHSRLACQIVVEYFMDGLRVYLPERQF